MNDAVWVVSPPRPEADALAEALSLPPAIARVLVNRKILTADAARAFLYGGVEGLHDDHPAAGRRAGWNRSDVRRETKRSGYA